MSGLFSLMRLLKQASIQSKIVPPDNHASAKLLSSVTTTILKLAPSTSTPQQWGTLQPEGRSCVKGDPLASLPVNHTAGRIHSTACGAMINYVQYNTKLVGQWLYRFITQTLPDGRQQWSWFKCLCRRLGIIMEL